MTRRGNCQISDLQSDALSNRSDRVRAAGNLERQARRASRRVGPLPRPQQYLCSQAEALATRQGSPKDSGDRDDRTDHARRQIKPRTRS